MAHEERDRHRAATDWLASPRAASPDVREMGKNTKFLFVSISLCSAGRFLLYPLAIVLLVVGICGEKLDLF